VREVCTLLNAVLVVFDFAQTTIAARRSKR